MQVRAPEADAAHKVGAAGSLARGVLAAALHAGGPRASEILAFMLQVWGSCLGGWILGRPSVAA